MKSINFENKQYTLIDDAYVSGGTDGLIELEAHAVDAQGVEYLVTWSFVNDDRELDDYDYSNPISVVKV